MIFLQIVENTIPDIAKASEKFISGQIILEIIIVLVVVFLQLLFFNNTKNKISVFSNIFPVKNDLYGLRTDESEKNNQQLITSNQFSSELNEIIKSINSYLKKNAGTADFSIIKSIAERSIESKENNALVNLSLPLYTGLMGTFIGIIVGLVNIAFFGGVTEQNINSFIGGVVIAMIASFFGLFFTVINNSYNYKKAKVDCDERKNKFYDFLQVELLPQIGNSLTDTLDRLKSNINDFNSKFEKNIKLFDSKFSENIDSLSYSVASLSENINIIVDNTKTQKEFLVELKSIGYNRMAEANIKVFKLLKETGPTFIQFIESQQKLSVSVEHANQFVGVIENILNRVKTFEEGINNLGEHINTNEFLGNEVLKRIDVNLGYLDNQFELLKQHEIKSTDSINDYFGKQFKEIQQLTDNIKKEIQDALNFQIDENPLKKLHLLSNIDANMLELNRKINFNDEFKNISTEVGSAIKEIQQIKNHLAESKVSKSRNNAIKKKEKDHTVPDKIKETTTTQKNKWLSRFRKLIGNNESQ